MREHAGVVRIPPAYPPQQPRILPGIDLRWQGPQLFEKPQVDAEGIMPDNDSFKTLHIIRPLGPHKDRSSVWLCSTSDSQDRPVDVVLKIFSAALHAKPDLRAYADNNLEPEQLWRWSPGPECVNILTRPSPISPPNLLSDSNRTDLVCFERQWSTCDSRRCKATKSHAVTDSTE